MILSDLYSHLAKREIAAILRCDISLNISSFEMALLQDTCRVDASLHHHLTFFMALEKLPSKPMDFSPRQYFVSIGNLLHAPNWDAVLYLQTIWPLIRKQLPEAELHIYGAYPPPKAIALHNSGTGFLIKACAEDAYAVMESVRVCLVLIIFGAGIKGKLLDAMITQTPSVTSSVGSDGMYLDELWPGVNEDDVERFVAAVVNSYSNEVMWQAAHKHASTLLRVLI